MSKKQKFVSGGIEFTVKRKKDTNGLVCDKCPFNGDATCGDAPKCGAFDYFKIVKVARVRPE